MGDALLDTEVLECLVSLRMLSSVSNLSQLPWTLSTHRLALPLLQGLCRGP